MTRSPQSGRSSIAAAEALVSLHMSGQFKLASLTWMTVVLIPHALYRHNGSVFLVLGQARHAARVWPARPATDCHEEGAQAWLFDIADTWSWQTVVAVREWWYVPTRWGLNREETSRFGFVAAYETHRHLPAGAHALIQKGPHGLLLQSRSDLVKAYGLGDQSLGKHEAEIELLRSLLDSHALCDDYLRSLALIHARALTRSTKKKKNSDSESESSSESSLEGVQGAFTLAALDEMDPANAKEFKSTHSKLKSSRATRRKAQGVRRDLRRDVEPEPVPPSCPADTDVLGPEGEGVLGDLERGEKPEGGWKEKSRRIPAPPVEWIP